VSNRDRFVIYSKWNYDASQIPPSCHSWLCHITDEIIDTNKGAGEGFLENLTGTAGAYKTFNTVGPKFSTWKPVVKQRS
jgi:NADH dehydrogenase (ubiquinone) 1 alpha subcomplex subunit 12